MAIVGEGLLDLRPTQEIVQRFSKPQSSWLRKRRTLVKHQTSHNRWFPLLTSKACCEACGNLRCISDCCDLLGVMHSCHNGLCKETPLMDSEEMVDIAEHQKKLAADAAPLLVNRGKRNLEARLWN